jgi:HD-GYP domain-containing protein (c-di-GMP phosphodiesterase class II)
MLGGFFVPGYERRAEACARDVAALAARLGLAAPEQERAGIAALVYDLGLMLLPDGLLARPGALTIEERRLMEAHAPMGALLVASLKDVDPAFAEIATAVKHHHERWDGLGYPDGLSSEQIPLVSRLISVADTYWAMTNDRPYRDALPEQEARSRLDQATGGQFDPSIVSLFHELLQERDVTLKPPVER